MDPFQTVIKDSQSVFDTFPHMRYIFQSRQDIGHFICKSKNGLEVRFRPKPEQPSEYDNTGAQMKELFFILVFLGIYILMQVYILPRMGIST